MHIGAKSGPYRFPFPRKGQWLDTLPYTERASGSILYLTPRNLSQGSRSSNEYQQTFSWGRGHFLDPVGGGWYQGNAHAELECLLTLTS